MTLFQLASTISDLPYKNKRPYDEKIIKNRYNESSAKDSKIEKPIGMEEISVKKIGFIGLGVMGLGMAANLLKKGFEVSVYNRTPGKAEALKALGASELASAADVARASDVVVTMISNDAAIRDVYWGENGIFAGTRSGMILIDSSTISPALAKELAAEAESIGASFLDAPVTGSKPAAEGGTLVFMAGGPADAVGEAQDVLLAMGRKVIPMGKNGSGSVAKLAHNTIVGINVVALAEGMAIAASGGIDGGAFVELVQSGGAASKAAEMKGPKLLEGNYDVQFSLELMLKDLKLSSALSDGLKVPTPLLEAAKSQFQVGDAMGLGSLDMCSIGQAYERWIGRKFGGDQS
ncbi:NAD(P)-dependent oxidoreductase [Paenibacillus arenilitoris]|uniref:NAD(P)-dependent oxidoreductase n=1 Tax=Paenibacillus arenilitoris TaxID=2772299 RepID=A0A927H4C3_9BACL|nr:NAD(P)-dependent oxidoreductase [Paenibacillus arenilitoris]MBD2867755.1 NAD(P)-dependent oxidoreductase [Paenibacillus arenilitoris]